MIQKIENVGKYIFVLPFINYVFLHFAFAKVGVEQLMPSWIPSPYFFEYGAGFLILLFIISVLTKKYDRLLSLIMAAYLTLVAGIIWLPKASDPMNLTNMFDVLVMVGACLIYAKYVSYDKRLVLQ